MSVSLSTHHPSKTDGLGQVTPPSLSLIFLSANWGLGRGYHIPLPHGEEAQEKLPEGGGQGSHLGGRCAAPAGDLCGPQEQWLRDRGNRHHGPADPSQLALSREDHRLPRRGKLRPTLVPQLLLLGVARICPALTGGLAWDEENILGHLEFK